ncbi:MAG: alpha/beta hydrolase [Elusimicrobiota bacterium]|nr:MAG: alpha/beta hydrolase [Elusimicrobiota bacterium]
MRGVILDSTFSSYRRVARGKLGSFWLTWPFQYPLTWGLVSDRWAPARLIARRKPVPLLMFHSTGDPVVPYAEGRRLYELAPGPKEFWKIEGTGHTEAMFAKGAQYRRPILEWLERALESGVRPND